MRGRPSGWRRRGKADRYHAKHCGAAVHKDRPGELDVARAAWADGARFHELKGPEGAAGDAPTAAPRDAIWNAQGRGGANPVGNRVAER